MDVLRPNHRWKVTLRACSSTVAHGKTQAGLMTHKFVKLKQNLTVRIHSSINGYQERRRGEGPYRHIPQHTVQPSATIKV